ISRPLFIEQCNILWLFINDVDMLPQTLCLHSNIDNIIIFGEEGFKGVLFHVQVDVSDMQ
ncbi:8952_t:CDS:1, partial [Funneliformis geosporum]